MSSSVGQVKSIEFRDADGKTLSTSTIDSLIANINQANSVMNSSDKKENEKKEDVMNEDGVRKIVQNEIEKAMNEYKKQNQKDDKGSEKKENSKDVKNSDQSEEDDKDQEKENTKQNEKDDKEDKKSSVIQNAFNHKISSEESSISFNRPRRKTALEITQMLCGVKNK